MATQNTAAGVAPPAATRSTCKAVSGENGHKTITQSRLDHLTPWLAQSERPLDSAGGGFVMTTNTTAPREMVYFALLDRAEQANAIKRLAAQGMNDSTIAAATRLSREQIRRILAEVNS